MPTDKRPGRAYAHWQTISAGTPTCGSEPSGMKCADTNTGHYFRVSRDLYGLG